MPPLDVLRAIIQIVIEHEQQTGQVITAEALRARLEGR